MHQQRLWLGQLEIDHRAMGQEVGLALGGVGLASIDREHGLGLAQLAPYVARSACRRTHAPALEQAAVTPTTYNQYLQSSARYREPQM